MKALNIIAHSCCPLLMLAVFGFIATRAIAAHNPGNDANAASVGASALDRTAALRVSQAVVGSAPGITPCSIAKGGP